MSILNWFKGGSVQSHMVAADQLFESGDYGDARLSYQKALSKSKGDVNIDATRIRAQLEACSHHLARKRIVDARQLFEMGEVERAFDAIEEIEELCEDSDILDEAAAIHAEFESRLENTEEDEAAELDDDDLLAIISGTWSSVMAAELSDMPPSFLQGLILAHEGEHGKAVELMQAAISEVDAAAFAYLELGKVYLEMGDLPKAEQALTRFVSQVGDDGEAEEEIILAYTTLSTICSELKKDEDARECLMQAYRSAPDNYVTLLNLGVFLRVRGELSEAKRSLMNAVDLMGSSHPEMRVFRELGLTCMALNQKEEAIEYLSGCASSCCGNGVVADYDPEFAVPLAQLYEEKGALREACDVYRHLANQEDISGRFLYHLESARLLKLLDASQDLIDDYVMRARELATNDYQVAQLEQHGL